MSLGSVPLLTMWAGTWSRAAPTRAPLVAIDENEVQDDDKEDDDKDDEDKDDEDKEVSDKEDVEKDIDDDDRSEINLEDEEEESDLQPAHRVEALDMLAIVELKFALLREKLYIEKMEELAWEESLVASVDVEPDVDAPFDVSDGEDEKEDDDDEGEGEDEKDDADELEVDEVQEDDDKDDEDKDDEEKEVSDKEDVEKDIDDDDRSEINLEDEEEEFDLQPVHRVEALDMLAIVELKFALLREKLYIEKMEELAWEESLVASGMQYLDLTYHIL
ncbi:hypothetical protein LENED_003237 [Lentinula edodes]|uniref:Uncharacterized protein n=1 Tax=Lentinula edodes TaxID=5353 RepID=A0A1Q3E328_LENED|nr:hypothetical protein LENED_003237 [Lentinula edodes]